MGKLNRTFQKLRRESRINFKDISEKCNIPIERVEELDGDAEFTNLELASICDALGITLDSFIKTSESTRMDYPYLIQVDIKGNPENSELYDIICFVESDRMNNTYSSECQGWKHNSFNEAVVVLENARNMLSSISFIPPVYHREGYLSAFLSHSGDHAYIGGKEAIPIRFGSKRQTSIDLDEDYLDDMNDFRDFDDF